MFEFLFNYPQTVFRKGEFVFASGWSGWLLVLVILAVGGGLAWHLRNNPGRLAGRPLQAVGVLQFLTAALVLLMLWQPAISIQSLRSQQNVVSVLVDTSRSMAIEEDGMARLEHVRAALDGGFLEQLEEKFRVRLYAFSSGLERVPSLEAIGPHGSSTRIGETVAGLLGESTVLPLGAVVVVSDGSDNTGAFNRELMAEIRQRKVPVHTVGVGRTDMPEDIELSDVRVANRTMPHSKVSAHVTVRHHGSRQTDVRLTVRDDVSILTSKTVTLRRGETVQTEAIDFNAGEAGVRNLRFSLDPLEDETILGNNAQMRVVDVPRGERSILYVEGEPRWEYKFIRRAIGKDKNIRLVTMLRTTPNKFYRQGVRDRTELVNGFPVTAEELFGYDALIIGSIEAAFFKPRQQDLIREFVSRRGGTLLLLGGRRGLGDGGWGVSKVAEALPAQLPESSKETFSRSRAAVELTQLGLDSVVCRLDEDPAANHKAWSGLPELADFQRIGALKPAAIRLVNGRLGNDTFPLLVQQYYGRGRAMILATGGTWRWKMQLPHDDTRHHTFWQQLLRSLTVHSPNRLALSSDRSLYADERLVKLRSEVRNAEFMPAGNATVTVTISSEDGDLTTLEMHPSADEIGVFEADLTAARTGTYRAEVQAHVGDDSLGSDIVHFRREDGLAEDFHPEQNRDLLETLAAQTGGRYWTLDGVDALPKEIRFSESGITARETLDLWDMPIFFLLCLGLRGGEWLCRRRWGVV